MYTQLLPAGNGRTHRRSGFTLIELLVVTGIALLVTTFTVIAIDFTFESERVRSGSRQLQSMLEGARDRAIFAREPRGVRFLLDDDPANGRKVSSMVYIGAGEEWREGTITLKRPDFVNGSGNPQSDNVVDALDFDGDGMSPETELFLVEGSPETLWTNLLYRGYLPPFERDANNNNTLDPAEDINSNGVWDQRTARIKIPGDKNGTWYTVSTYWLGKDPQRPNRLRLMTQYRDPGTTPAGTINGFENGAGPTSYILELPPRVLPDA
ncbi:MAG: prepilin-type N-terminal cleavage/methylation domain-containing protein, partial [Planctomycetaceae bacterium]